MTVQCVNSSTSTSSDSDEQLTLLLTGPLWIPIRREIDRREPQLRKDPAALRIGLEVVVHLEEHDLQRPR